MLRDDFIGSWQLIDYVTLLEDGTRIEPLGASPYGIGTYTDAGWMSAHLMRHDRRPLGSPRPALDRLPSDLLAETAAGYIGYAGKFTIDSESRRVIHHVEAAFIPDWVGTDMIREYQFAGGILALRPPAAGGASSVLRWRRAS